MSLVIKTENGPEIFIDQESWSKLNEEKSKDEIKEMISDAIDAHNIPLPYRHITEQDMKESWSVQENHLQQIALSCVERGEPLI